MGNTVKVENRFGAWQVLEKRHVCFKYFPFPYNIWAENKFIVFYITIVLTKFKD